MPESARVITNTTAYPTFASKDAFMDRFREVMDQNHGNHSLLVDLLNRLSNTDTSAWADPTARHDA